MDGSGDWFSDVESVSSDTTYIIHSDLEDPGELDVDFLVDQHQMGDFPSIGSPDTDNLSQEPYTQKTIHIHDILHEYFHDPESEDPFFANFRSRKFESILEYMHAKRNVERMKERDPYNDDEAEMAYMLSKPTCFMIVGKPTNANRNLAKRLSDYWGCMLIDAETVVKEELKNGPGKLWPDWLQLTLKSGKAIEPDDIFQLICFKMQSPAAQHVGYVLIGVPTVPDLRSVTGYSPSSQLNYIMDSDMRPDVIIYSSCSHEDVCYMREKLKYDTTSGIEIDYHIVERTRTHKHFTVHKDERQEPYEDPWDEDEKEIRKLIDASNMHHCFVKMPHHARYIDGPSKDAWFDYYEQSYFPAVADALMRHDSKYVIHVDGRTSSYHMMEVVKAKLETLPLTRAIPVVLMSGHAGSLDLPEGAESWPPEPRVSSTADNLSASGEDDSDHKANYYGSDIDKAFVKLCDSQKAGPRFRWHWSDWGKRCPVMSMKCFDVLGRADLACRFMDKIYFLSCEEACESFRQNPRPYLMNVEEHLPDRIFIAGPRLSGKTTVANRIAKTVGAKVFDMRAIEEKMLDDRPVKRATSALAVMVYDMTLMAQEEAILEYLYNTYAFHKSLVLYNRYYSNIAVMKCIVDGEIDRYEMPTEFLLHHEESFDEYMAHEPVPVLRDFCAAKSEYTRLIKDFCAATNNSVANSYVLPDYDKASKLAEKIKQYLNEKTRDPSGKVVDSTKAWIVDNAPLNISFWKHLEDEEIFPNRVIFLYDSEFDYNLMLSKFVGSTNYLELSFREKQDLDKATNELAEHELRERETKKAEATARREAQRQFEEASKEAAEKEMREASRGSKVASSLTYGLGSPFPKSSSVQLLKESEKEEQEETPEPDSISLTEEEIRSHSYSSSEIIFTNKALRSASLIVHNVNLPLQDEYEDEAFNLTREWLKLAPFIAGKARGDTIVINTLTLPALLEIAEGRTNVALLPQARKKTNHEKTEERRIERFVSGGGMHADYWAASAASREHYCKNITMKNFGDTFVFCPVLFKNKNVLKFGKDQHTCVYRDKTYRMSSPEAEEAFLANPTAFVGRKTSPDHDPSNLFRFCVVGPIGSQITKMAKKIASALNLNYFNFDKIMEQTYMQGFDEKIGRKYEGGRVRELLGLPLDNSDSDLSTSDEFEDPTSSSEEDEESVDVGRTSRDAEGIFVDSDAMKEALHEYLVLGKRIPSPVLDAVVANTWFPERESQGIVMAGFPSRPSDIKYMEKRGIVPNAILYLEPTNDSETVSKACNEFIAYWKERQEVVTAQRALLPSPSINANNRGGSNSSEVLGEDDESRQDSHLSPAEEWRRNLRRIRENVKFWYSEDTSFFRDLREYARSENVCWVALRGESFGGGDYLLREVNRIRELRMFRYVTHDEADALIKCGYYLMSKFGRWCPVQIFVEDDTFPGFRPCNYKNSFPVIYRKFIYYIASKENLRLFENNPEKYVTTNSYIPLLDMRIAVVGPPKSGKTSLCTRLAEDYGLCAISPGNALRYVLTNLGWTNQGKRLKDQLKLGRIVSSKMLLEAALAFSMDTRGTVNGFVFDGFPILRCDVLEMEKNNVVPMFIVHIASSKDAILKSIMSQEEHEFYLGTETFFSDEHLKVKIDNWYATSPSVLAYLEHRFKNVIHFIGPISKWQLSDTTKRLFEFQFLNMVSYDQAGDGCPHSLKHVNVTPQEFDSRIGPTEHYCVVCWATKYHLITEGYPPPTHGLINYKGTYYYVCPSHQTDFLLHPTDFLHFDMKPKPNQMQSPNAPCSFDKLYANGLCIVTYVNNHKPCRITGLKSLAVTYGEYTYLFANEKCRNQFLENPELYCSRKIRFKQPPQVIITIPPVLSTAYLEQNISSVVQTAVDTLVKFRPSLSRVNIKRLATAYVGLQLLSANPETKPSIKNWARLEIQNYQEMRDYVDTVFNDCRQMLKSRPEEFLN